VVSRDGKYMAAPVDAESGKSLWIMEVTADAPPPPQVTQVDSTEGHGFATISPDDTYVAAAWKGVLWTVRRDTGEYLEDIPLGDVEGTQPDWSPNGSPIVFATGKDDAPGGASIATIDYDGPGQWGTPEVIVPAEDDRTNLFPMFSPDGDWIAFSRGKGGHDDDEAQLYVVGADGSDLAELVNANRVVSNEMTDGQHQNSQPTWAPPGDLYWIAFNSKRSYGVVKDGGTQQIWVAAVDPDKLGTDTDPSFPAFRLQFQGLEEDNHRAFWTLDVREPQPPPPDAPDAGPAPDASVCAARGETCDPGAATACCDPYDTCGLGDGGFVCKGIVIP
jgi:hypothetical protein